MDEYLDYIDENSLITGCGGIENWLLCLSRELATRKGNEITVFCHCHRRHVSRDNVEFIPVNDMEREMQGRKFDNIIITRDMWDIVPILKRTDNSGNVFCQAHDIVMKHYKDEINFNFSLDMQYMNIRKYVVLSDFHKAMLQQYQGIPEDMIVKIGNGIDPNDFPPVDTDHEIDHGILWNSAYNRIPNILVESIMPEVRKEIPDFYVEMSSYLDNDIKTERKEFEKNENVRILGRLKRNDLLQKLKTHACWFNPGLFPENFCLSMIEAALSSNDVIMDLRNFGPADIMKPFVKETTLHTDFRNSSRFKESVMESAGRIVDSILNYHNPAHIERRNEIRKYILKKYTWKEIADEWIELFSHYE